MSIYDYIVARIYPSEFGAPFESLPNPHCVLCLLFSPTFLRPDFLDLLADLLQTVAFPLHGPMD